MLIHDVNFYAYIYHTAYEAWLKAEVKWMIYKNDEHNIEWCCAIEEGDHVGEIYVVETPHIRFRSNWSKGRMVARP